MKTIDALALACLAILASQPAFAVTTSGGIDPQVGLAAFLQWSLVLAGFAIPLICTWKGVHAAAEGRHIGPYVGSAIGGTGLAFGGAYILSHWGVI